MKKILISLLAILLLPACTPDSSVKPNLNWNGLNLVKGTKCPVAPTPGDCVSGPIEALIEVDASGAPTGVSSIQSCEGKKVTWKYKNDFTDGKAPPFFIVFDPADFPGNSSYDPVSKAKPTPVNAQNQELTIHTRKMKDAPECLNYMIVSPDKGILDPVFIIKR